IVPVLLGAGESLFGDVNLSALGYGVEDVTQSESGVVHVRIAPTT
ncbi:MAG: dihydrofolate reductase, partial [Actinobacteria bacterium]|nr:dihydrofolate reductase [Actinomycetota bacterium]